MNDKCIYLHISCTTDAESSRIQISLFLSIDNAWEEVLFAVYWKTDALNSIKH